MKVFKEFTAANGIPFTIRIVFKGGQYGLNDCLVHDKAEPMIEFHDARYKTRGFDPELGQFVTRYYLKTLLGLDQWGSGNVRNGINLHLGEPNWKIDGETLVKIVSWVIDYLAEAATPASDDPGVIEAEKGGKHHPQEPTAAGIRLADQRRKNDRQGRSQT